MLLTQTIQAIFDAALCLAYPQCCLLCGASVELRSLGVTCKECWSKVKLFQSAAFSCWKCGRPSASNVRVLNTEVSCHECDAQYFTAARACGVYEGALRQNVLALKKSPFLPGALLDLLIDVASQSPLSSATRIIPIPLHPLREQKRGFNQASVMARRLSRVLQWPVDEVSVKRIRHSERYRAGLDFKSRSDTVADAFEVTYSGLVRNETILLLDDVFTTGATVSSCAKVLMNAGAASVYVLTLGRPGH